MTWDELVKHGIKVILPAEQELKAWMLREQLRLRNLDTFVETGTFKGDMVAAMLPFVRRAFSVELDPRLYAECQERFAKMMIEENFPGEFMLYQGDSAVVLPEILRHIHGPALFWLDAHHVQGTGVNPLLTELDLILTHRNDHLIAVDDIRLFGMDPAYPRVTDLVNVAARHGVRFDLVLDIAWIGASSPFVWAPLFDDPA